MFGIHPRPQLSLSSSPYSPHLALYSTFTASTESPLHSARQVGTLPNTGDPDLAPLHTLLLPSLISSFSMSPSRLLPCFRHLLTNSLGHTPPSPKHYLPRYSPFPLSPSRCHPPEPGSSGTPHVEYSGSLLNRSMLARRDLLRDPDSHAPLPPSRVSLIPCAPLTLLEARSLFQPSVERCLIYATNIRPPHPRPSPSTFLPGLVPPTGHFQVEPVLPLLPLLYPAQRLGCHWSPPPLLAACNPPAYPSLFSTYLFPKTIRILRD